MFDIVHKHKHFAQIVLGLITLPFALFGTFQYFQSRSAGDQSVASVGRNKISQADFDEALRDQQQRMRQALGANFDPAMFDNSQVRYALLDELVNQRLLENQARADRFRVSDTQLQQFIAGLPPFQDSGAFSPDKYREVLASQGMSPLVFEQRVRGDLVLSPLQDPIVGGSIAGQRAVQRYLALLDQKREVAVAPVPAEPFEKSVQVRDDEIKAYYDQNPKAFETPEMAKFEYLLLTQDAIAAQIKLDPAEVKQSYEANSRQYTTSEERQASHILIAVRKDATDAEKAAAKKKAIDIAAEARAAPQTFAELAKKYSQDPGSSAQGGDLGSFARGAMVKPFEDAVFAAKIGDIVGPVQTDFGYHIIKVMGVTPPHVQTFDEVKGRIEANLRRQKAAQKFAAAADQFQNLVYEQADSLAGAAKALDLEVQTSGFVTRAQAQALAMNNAKFVDALLSPESVQSKRNTEAMEVGQNALMAGRIIDFKPAAPKPFADVRNEIRAMLVHRKASDLAQKSGREKLALLEQGKEREAGLTFGKAVTLTRNEVKPEFPPDALKAIFQTDEHKLPAYAGLVNERGGFSIYKVDKVIEPPSADATKTSAASASIGNEIGRELMNAYLASLRADTEVTINQAAVERKSTQ